MAKRLLYQALTLVQVVVPTPIPFAQTETTVPYERTLLYQSIAEPVPIVSAAPTVGVDSWFEPLSEPTRRQTRTSDLIVFVSPVPAPSAANVLFATSATFVNQSSTLLYQSIAEPIPIVSAETVTADKWFRPLSEPTRRPKRTADLIAFVPLDSAKQGGWQQPFSEPIRIKRQVDRPEPAFVPVVTETVTADKWLSRLSEPIRIKWQADRPEPAFVPVVAPVVAPDQWLSPLSEPVRRKVNTPTSAEAFEPPVAAPAAVNVLFAQTSTSVTHSYSLLYQSITSPIQFAAPVVTTTIEWFSGLSLPPDGGAMSIDLSVDFIAVEIPSFGWFRPLGEPVRLKSRLITAAQQAAWLVSSITAPTPGTGDVLFSQTSVGVPAYQSILYPSIAQPVSFAPPETITVDKWYEPLSEPRRKRPSVAQQQDLAFVKAAPFPETVTWDRWGQQFVNPPKKRSLHASQQQAVAFTALSPTVVAPEQWFNELSGPVRVKFAQYLTPSTVWIPTPPTLFTPWFVPLSQPVRSQPRRDVAQPAFVRVVTPEIVTVDKWYPGLATPTLPRSYRATLAPFSFPPNYLVPAPYVDAPVASWNYGFSSPVRLRLGLLAASQSGTVIPIIPIPNPPVAPGVYTVSGLYVIDQFTDNTVVYDYAGGVSHRTN